MYAKTGFTLSNEKLSKPNIFIINIFNRITTDAVTSICLLFHHSFYDYSLINHNLSVGVHTEREEWHMLPANTNKCQIDARYLDA